MEILCDMQSSSIYLGKVFFFQNSSSRFMGKNPQH
jgi:hypothetical protein